jgi:hypothetical protein
LALTEITLTIDVAIMPTQAFFGIRYGKAEVTAPGWGRRGTAMDDLGAGQRDKRGGAEASPRHDTTHFFAVGRIVAAA